MTFIRQAGVFETDWDIVISISAGLSAVISLHRVKKFGEIPFSDPGV